MNHRQMAVALLLLVVTTVTGSAAIWTVNALTDTGEGSGTSGDLRYCVNNAASGDTIDATGISATITLSSGQLSLSQNITINGPGANVLTIDGNQAGRIFQINPQMTGSISGLTIANGN